MWLWLFGFATSVLLALSDVTTRTSIWTGRLQVNTVTGGCLPSKIVQRIIWHYLPARVCGFAPT